jgi:hypothetical protein
MIGIEISDRSDDTTARFCRTRDLTVKPDGQRAAVNFVDLAPCPQVSQR